MWANLQESADLVAFTKEILNGKLLFFVQCRVNINVFLGNHQLQIFSWVKLCQRSFEGFNNNISVEILYSACFCNVCINFIIIFVLDISENHLEGLRIFYRRYTQPSAIRLRNAFCPKNMIILWYKDV